MCWLLAAYHNGAPDCVKDLWCGHGELPSVAAEGFMIGANVPTRPIKYENTTRARIKTLYITVIPDFVELYKKRYFPLQWLVEKDS